MKFHSTLEIHQQELCLFVIEILRSDELSQESGLTTPCLTGDKKVLDEVKKRERMMVELTGLIRAAQVAPQGIGLFGGRIRIGGARVPQDPITDPLNGYPGQVGVPGGAGRLWLTEAPAKPRRKLMGPLRTVPSTGCAPRFMSREKASGPAHSVDCRPPSRASDGMTLPCAMSASSSSIGTWSSGNSSNQGQCGLGGMKAPAELAFELLARLPERPVIERRVGTSVETHVREHVRRIVRAHMFGVPASDDPVKARRFLHRHGDELGEVGGSQ